MTLHIYFQSGYTVVFLRRDFITSSLTCEFCFEILRINLVVRNGII